MIKWAIQNYDKHTFLCLKDALVNNHIEFDIVYEDNKIGYKREVPVIFHGSPPLAHLLEKSPIYSYYGGNATDALRFTEILNSHVLNTWPNITLVPKKMLVKNWGWYINTHLFIRGESFDSVLRGQIFNFIDCDKFDSIDYNGLCILAPYVSIKKNCRFVVVNGNVITGSCYYPEADTSNSEDREWMKAQKIADIYTTYVRDYVYTIDIVTTKNDSLYVLDINPFSCAKLYECDYNIIVKEISRYTQHHDSSL